MGLEMRWEGNGIREEIELERRWEADGTERAEIGEGGGEEEQEEELQIFQALGTTYQ